MAVLLPMIWVGKARVFAILDDIWRSPEDIMIVLVLRLRGCRHEHEHNNHI